MKHLNSRGRFVYALDPGRSLDEEVAEVLEQRVEEALDKCAELRAYANDPIAWLPLEYVSPEDAVAADAAFFQRYGMV